MIFEKQIPSVIICVDFIITGRLLAHFNIDKGFSNINWLRFFFMVFSQGQFLKLNYSFTAVIKDSGLINRFVCWMR